MYPAVVSPEWLVENISQTDIRVFDVTFFENETVERAQHLFAKEHITNSTQLLLRGRDFSGNFYNKLPKPTTMTLLATKQGFSRGIHAVFYDRDGKSAIRAWFLFQYFDFIKVSVLHGGMQLYSSKGLPMTHKKIERLAETPVTAFAAAARANMVLNIKQFEEICQGLKPSALITQTSFPQNYDAIVQYEQLLDQKQTLNQLDFGPNQPTDEQFEQIIDTRDRPKHLIKDAIRLPYTVFYKDKARTSFITDIMRVRQIVREHGIDCDRKSLLVGSNGFDTNLVCFLMFLSTVRGLNGLQILVGDVEETKLAQSGEIATHEEDDSAESPEAPVDTEETQGVLNSELPKQEYEESVVRDSEPGKLNVADLQ